MDTSRFTSKGFLIPGLTILILLALLATLPIYAPGYSVILFPTIFMYIILAVSWTIFSGPTGYISLAPAAFFGVGLYAAAILGKTFQISTSLLGLLAVVGIGGILSFILALLVGALTLRLRGIYFAVFTFGLVMFIAYALLFWELHVTGTRGRFVSVVDYTTIYYVMLGIMVILLFTAYFIRRSRFGLALQAIGENEDAAAHMGVNVTLIKVVTFAISSFFMGAAGAIMATSWTYIDPFIAFNPFFSFMPVAMALVGGVGQIYGPVIGAAFLTYLEEFLKTRFAELYPIIFGLILVFAVVYLPNGLVGLIEKLRKRGPKEQHANT